MGKTKATVNQASQPVQNCVSITRALAECKVLSDRLERAMKDSSLQLCDIQVGGVLKSNPKKSVKEFNADITASLQSISDLAGRLARIKGRIAELNATTKLTVCGKEYTPYVLMMLVKTSVFDYDDLLRDLSPSTIINKYERSVAEAEQKAYNACISAVANTGNISKADLKAGNSNVPSDAMEIYSGVLEKAKPTLVEYQDNATKWLEEQQRAFENFINEAKTALDRYNILTEVCID